MIILKKNRDFERIIIVDIDKEGDSETILKKAEDQLPLYICIPVYDYSSFMPYMKPYK